MTVELLITLAFALLSLADLRYRVAPAIEVLFLAAVLLAAPVRPLDTAVVVLATAWGWVHTWPGLLVWPLLLHPLAWPVLLVGFGVRQGLIGRADLLAVGVLACLFPWPALILAGFGLELWRRRWASHRPGPVPALPGMLLGLMSWWLGGWVVRWLGS